MPTHTTPPPHADQTDQTAEPAQRAPRFDERGIALQTIIIMVVLLAIAGSVAAVLFSRASEETARLEGSEALYAYAITDRLQCSTLGHSWTNDPPTDSGDQTLVAEALGEASYNADWYKAKDPTKPAQRGYTGFCKPTP